MTMRIMMIKNYDDDVLHSLEVSAVFRPQERLDSIDTDSNRP
jgi:hypothetical protein